MKNCYVNVHSISIHNSQEAERPVTCEWINKMYNHTKKDFSKEKAGGGSGEEVDGNSVLSHSVFL